MLNRTKTSKKKNAKDKQHTRYEISENQQEANGKSFLITLKGKYEKPKKNEDKEGGLESRGVHWEKGATSSGEISETVASDEGQAYQKRLNEARAAHEGQQNLVKDNCNPISVGIKQPRIILKPLRFSSAPIREEIARGVFPLYNKESLTEGAGTAE